MTSPKIQTSSLDDLYRQRPLLLEESSRAYPMTKRMPDTRFNGRPKTLNDIGVNAGLEHVLGHTRDSFKAFLRNDQPLVSLPSFQPALANLTERGGKMRIALLDAAPSGQLLDLQNHYSEALHIALARTGEEECAFPNAAVSDYLRAYEWGPKQSKSAKSSLHFDDRLVSSVNARLDIIWEELTGEEPDPELPESWVKKLVSKFARS